MASSVASRASHGKYIEHSGFMSYEELQSTDYLPNTDLNQAVLDVRIHNVLLYNVVI